MTIIDPGVLAGATSLGAAIVERDGAVVWSNAAFRAFTGWTGTGNVASYFVRPSFEEHLAKPDGTTRRMQVGPPGSTPRVMQGSLHTEGERIVLVLEADAQAYEALSEQVMLLNGELVEMQRELARRVTQLQRSEAELRATLAEVRTLRGLLPICATCKRIKDDTGYWQNLESFIEQRSEAEFSHGICAECLAKQMRQADASDA